jgi:hypothetical protein
VQGETVTQATSGAVGRVSQDCSATPLRIFLNSNSAATDNTHVWTGGTSGATATASATATATGAGTYTLASGSPLRSKIPAGGAVLSYDLAGNAFGNLGNGSAGAYQYAADITPPSGTGSPAILNSAFGFGFGF